MYASVGLFGDALPMAILYRRGCHQIRRWICNTITPWSYVTVCATSKHRTDKFVLEDIRNFNNGSIMNTEHFTSRSPPSQHDCIIFLIYPIWNRVTACFVCVHSFKRWFSFISLPAKTTREQWEHRREHLCPLGTHDFYAPTQWIIPASMDNTRHGTQHPFGTRDPQHSKHACVCRALGMVVRRRVKSLEIYRHCARIDAYFLCIPIQARTGHIIVFSFMRIVYT